MTTDFYNRITTALEGFIEDAYDGKLPDYAEDGSQWALTAPVIVVYGISDVPTTSVDGAICLREQRVTCEIQALDLGVARVIKEALIAKYDPATGTGGIHMWRGTLVKVCTFENGGPELFDLDLNPPRYCLPVDFMLTF